MAILNLSQELIEEKRELVLELDSCTDKQKSLELAKRIGELETQIYRNAIDTIEHSNESAQETMVSEEKSIYSAAELKKILNAKYTIYKELAMLSRELYGELITKKKAGRNLHNQLSTNAENITQQILEY